MTVVVTIRLTDIAQEWVEAVVDLLEAIETADAVLLTDEVAEKARAVRDCFERGEGQV